jgi:hypothetical protein
VFGALIGIFISLYGYYNVRNPIKAHIEKLVEGSLTSSEIKWGFAYTWMGTGFALVMHTLLFVYLENNYEVPYGWFMDGQCKDKVLTL